MSESEPTIKRAAEASEEPSKKRAKTPSTTRILVHVRWEIEMPATFYLIDANEISISQFEKLLEFQCASPETDGWGEHVESILFDKEGKHQPYVTEHEGTEDIKEINDYQIVGFVTLDGFVA